MTFNGVLRGKFGYWALTKLVKKAPSEHIGEVNVPNWETKLDLTFGCDLRSSIKDNIVLDYGCGNGHLAVTIAKMGARRVIGLDINDRAIKEAQRLAIDANVERTCLFFHANDDVRFQDLFGKVDVILSHDAFEHYSDPDRELSMMWKLLRQRGELFVSFGPPWWHPYGCHMMFMGAPPWAHVLFHEETIMAVRERYRSDGAMRFEDVEGGLNRMTLGRFEHLIHNSGFTVMAIRYVPIRSLRLLSATKLGREFFTSVVRAHLLKPSE